MLRKVCEALERLESTGSSNEKKEILSEIKNSDFVEAFKFILDTALNPFLTYGIKKIDDGKVYSEIHPPMESVRLIRDKLANRELTGHAAAEALRGRILVEDALIRKWLVRTFEKKLRAGITEKTANKVFSKLIPTFDIGLCDVYKGKKFPEGDWVIEPKLDGLRCLCFIDENGNCKFMSRGNKPICNTHIIEREIRASGMKNFVLDGELMATDWHDTISIAHTETEHPEADKMNLHVFDILTMEEWNTRETKPLKTRKSREGLFHYGAKHLFMVPYVIFGDYDNAYEEHVRHLQAGFEGSVMKNYESEYPFKRSKNWLKWKPVNTYEVLVKAFEEGTGRNAGMLGALLCDFNGHEVKVGNGFKEEQRKEFWINRELVFDKYIEVEAQEVTKDGSLRFPVFLRVREDLK